VNGFTDKCHRHPEHPAWKCRPCDAESAPPPVDWRDTITATLTRRARTARRLDTTPDTDRIEQVRAALDAEEAQK
jgi:hypothetical protein